MKNEKWRRRKWASRQASKRAKEQEKKSKSFLLVIVCFYFKKKNKPIRLVFACLFIFQLLSLGLQLLLSLIGNKLRFSQQLFALLCVVGNVMCVYVCMCLLPVELFLSMQSNYARSSQRIRCQKEETITFKTNKVKENSCTIDIRFVVIFPISIQNNRLNLLYKYNQKCCPLQNYCGENVSFQSNFAFSIVSLFFCGHQWQPQFSSVCGKDLAFFPFLSVQAN